MPTFSNIAGQEPSTVTFRLATIAITRGTTTEQSEIQVLGDPNTSNALAAVLNATPASTAWGLVTRPVFSSTGADNPVSVSNWSSVVSVANTVTIQGNSTVVVSGAVSIQGNSTVTFIAGLLSTAPPVGSTGLVVQQAGYVAPSTTITVSNFSTTVSVANQSTIVSVANTVTIQGNSTVTFPATLLSSATPAANSTGLVVQQAGYVAPSTTISVANTVTIQGNSTVVVSGAVTIGTNLQSSVAPSSASSGLMVRPIIDAILTTASTDAFGTSTSFAINTSVAGVRAYITAYTILSTVAGSQQVGFYTSNTLLWPMVFAAPSSAVSGANLAVSAPAYLFRGGAAEAVSLRVPSTITGWTAGVSYFLAP